jgi:hypothetical protein
MIQIKGPTDAVEAGFDAPYHGPMFTIEHDFDATVITLIDEGESPLAEDVIVEAFEDCVVIEQLDARPTSPCVSPCRCARSKTSPQRWTCQRVSTGANRAVMRAVFG